MKNDSRFYVGKRVVIGMTLWGEPITEPQVVCFRSDGHHALDTCLHLRNHCPTGFEWGYEGSGPAQLALALVADACGENYATPAAYQLVKRRIVAHLKHEEWNVDAERIREVVRRVHADLTESN